MSHPEESSREAFVQNLGGRIARFVPGTSAMFFFFNAWKWRVGYLPGSFSMIVKARRVRKMHMFFCFFWMAEIAPKCQQCLRGQCGKAGSCEGPAI